MSSWGSGFLTIQPQGGGAAREAPVTLCEIRLEQLSIDNVPAAVNDNPKVSLLGMSFLKRLKSFEMREGGFDHQLVRTGCIGDIAFGGGCRSVVGRKGAATAPDEGPMVHSGSSAAVLDFYESVSFTPANQQSLGSSSNVFDATSRR
jgi:hypothetical protein